MVEDRACAKKTAKSSPWNVRKRKRDIKKVNVHPYMILSQIGGINSAD